MEISFRTSKLKKICNEHRKAVKEWGTRCAKLVGRRLDELKAAESLEDLRFIPKARCHELTQNRKGQFAVDLDHPYRLIFKPAHDPVPIKDDGGLAWSQVTAITIVEVTDYHG